MTTPVRVRRTRARPRADSVAPLRGQRRPRVVVVVVGGFAGLAAVHGLRGSDADVTLIDRHTYNTFQPLLYQVATATLNAGDITWFLRSIRAHRPRGHDGHDHHHRRPGRNTRPDRRRLAPHHAPGVSRRRRWPRGFRTRRGVHARFADLDQHKVRADTAAADRAADLIVNTLPD